MSHKPLTRLAFVLITSLSAPAQLELRSTQPPAGSPAMAFDTTGARTLMFGDSAWARQAGPWAPLHGVSSPPVAAYGIASAGTVGIIVFGGVNQGSLVSDTWVFNGNNWSMTGAVQAPSPRRSPLMAFDSVRNVVVLHGGLDATSSWLSDTWEWDPVGGWVLIPTATAPPDRGTKGMAFSAATGQVTLVTGGGSLLGPTLEIWEFDGFSWSHRHTASFVMDYTVAASPDGRGVVLFGGWIPIGMPPPMSSAVFLWDGQQLTNVPPGGQAPVGRVSASLSVDASRGRLVMYGGRISLGVPTSSTWEWDGQQWHLPPGGAVPPPRIEPALVYFASRGTVFLHGGDTQGIARLPLSDTYERVGSSWQSRGTGPALDALTYDAARDRIVAVDGSTWEHDGTAWQLVSNAVPYAFGGVPRMAYYAAAGQCLLFDGARTWSWDGATWLQLNPMTSPTTPALAMTYDSRRQQVVAAVDQPTPGVWAWDGSDWTSLSSGLPFYSGTGAGFGPLAMTYDQGRDRVVCIDDGREVWEWDGSSWSLPIQVFGLPASPAIAYDPQASYSIVFSGSETFELASAHPASVAAFGLGCAGTSGIPSLDRVGPGPWVGSPFQLAVNSGPGTTPLFGVTGFHTAAWQGQPLPFNLGGFGMANCLLYTDVLVAEFLTGSTWIIMVPNQPTLAGLVAYHQALVLDPGANLGNAIVTNAARATIGLR